MNGLYFDNVTRTRQTITQQGSYFVVDVCGKELFCSIVMAVNMHSVSIQEFGVSWGSA